MSTIKARITVKPPRGGDYSFWTFHAVCACRAHQFLVIASAVLERNDEPTARACAEWQLMAHGWHLKPPTCSRCSVDALLRDALTGAEEARRD